MINKVYQGRPHVVDRIKDGGIAIVLNTTEGAGAIRDSYTPRRAALEHKIPITRPWRGARGGPGDDRAGRARPCGCAPAILLSNACFHISSAARVFSARAPHGGIDDRADSDDLERLRASRGGAEALKNDERPAVIRALAERASTAISRRTPNTMPRASARASSKGACSRSRTSWRARRSSTSASRAAARSSSAPGQAGRRGDRGRSGLPDRRPRGGRDPPGLLSITAPLGRA